MTSFWTIGTGMRDFNTNFTDSASSFNGDAGGLFSVNRSDGLVFLPGDWTVPGNFSIIQTQIYNADIPTLGWDLTPFVLSLPGGQSIFFFAPPLPTAEQLWLSRPGVPYP